MFKTASKRAIQKVVEAIGDLTGNKHADKVIKGSNIHNKTIQRQLEMRIINRYLKKDIPSEERQKIIDDLTLI